jgi:hypothetical protein
MENTIKINATGEKLEIHNFNYAEQKINEPVKISINGNIDAPINWIAKRENLFNKEIATIEIDIDNGIIEFCENKSDLLAPTVKGVLKPNPILQELCINSNKTFDSKTFAQFVKMKRAYFSDKTSADKLYKSLMNFKASFTNNSENTRDNKGNKVLNAQITINETSINEYDFIVEVPIFIGAPTSKFSVEIICEYKSIDAEFQLISSELSEILILEKERILREQEAFFKEKGFIVILK